MFEIYGRQKRCKKRILVICDSETNNVLYSTNDGLKNYQLVGLPCIPGSAKSIVETQLRENGYDGILVDELYLDFLEKVKHRGKKYGIIRWSDFYDAGTKKIMNENKTVKFGCELPSNIEKDLDRIFS